MTSATKGGMVNIFKVGQMVQFSTKGKGVSEGRIVKLHNSSASGVAEIRPSDGSRKVSRRLIHVSRMGKGNE